MRALVLLPMLAACSFTVGSVPRDYRARRGGPLPSCEETFAGRAIADMVGAAGFAWIARFAYGFSNLRCAPDGDCDRRVSAALPWLIPAALHLAAIAYGVTVTNTCTRVRTEHARLQW